MVLPLRLLPVHWPLTVHVALDFLGRSVVCVCWLAVTLTVLVTTSAIGGTAGEFDGARTAGEIAVAVVPPPP